MAARSRWQCLLLFFLASLSLALAASPTSFCKCTCFTNSTIIPLDDAGGESPPPSSSSSGDESPLPAARGCNECNKQFCLDYNLPICESAEESDVFTTCFQRDSVKDEVVVFIFIFATLGLLIWAAVKPWLAKWREDMIVSRGRYARVGGEGQ